MSNVTLDIGGRSFTVACAEGEEGHVAGLGRMIDSRIDSVEGAAAQNESRMLLFAALLLADELHELSGNRAEGSNKTGAMASRLDTIAQRIENIAQHLEGAARNA